MAETEQRKPKTRAAKKPVRIEVVDKRGNIARPLEADLDKWLAAGWTRNNPVEQTD